MNSYFKSNWSFSLIIRFFDPFKPNEGIHLVYINGMLVLEDNGPTGVWVGKISEIMHNNVFYWNCCLVFVSTGAICGMVGDFPDPDQSTQPVEVRFPQDTAQIQQAQQDCGISCRTGSRCGRKMGAPDRCHCAGQGQRCCPEGDPDAGDLQKTADAQTEIDDMGYKKADKIALHAVFWEQNVQKSYIHGVGENIVPDGMLLLSKPLDHGIGHVITV